MFRLPAVRSSLSRSSIFVGLLASSRRLWPVESRDPLPLMRVADGGVPRRSRILQLIFLCKVSVAAVLCGCLVILAGTIQLVMPLGAHGQQLSAPNHSVVEENYGKLPLSFEANQGQSDPQVKFQSRGSGYSLFLTDSSAVLALTKQDAANAKSGGSVVKGLKVASVPQTGKTDVVRMKLAGASRNMHVTGVDPLPGKANYFIGNDPAKWQSGVPTYAKVQYTGVYPGIDLVYYGNQRQLEYDFVIAPGANPKPIRLQFAGAKKLKLTTDGDLTVAATNGEIAFHKPVIYQLKNGKRQPIEGQFSLLAKNTVSFTLGQYDHTEPLVIDPVLVYATYFAEFTTLYSGGAIAVDSVGNVYVTGSATAGYLPVTTGAFQALSKGECSSQTNCTGDYAPNAFVTKLNPTGTALVYSTYLGGSLGDYGEGIAVDSAGNAYVTGTANSTNFPVTAAAFQTVNKIGPLDITNVPPGPNAFVTKLNPTGTALIYSTYLGGSGVQWANVLFTAPGSTAAPYFIAGDNATAIAVDSTGNAYVTGMANSADFPVTSGAFQTANNSPGYILPNYGVSSNAFVTKLNPSGTALVYSTYLGGTGESYQGGALGDTANSIALDGSGNVYVTGYASSSNFPVTQSAFQMVNNAATGYYNAFVTKLNSAGTALLYSTYLGGSAFDYGTGIAVDSSGDAYVTGQTLSNNFPVTVGAFQTVNATTSGSYNAFVTKLNSAGTALLYSTYLGGSVGNGHTQNFGPGIAVDSSGDAYVTGQTHSNNFPVTVGAFQTVNNAGVLGTAFVTKLNPTGTALLYSTYLGGSGNNGGDAGDSGVGIAVDSSDNAYVIGSTASQNFPVTAGAYQTTQQQYGTTAFIAKLNLGSGIPSPTVTVTPSSSSITAAQALMVTVEVDAASGGPTPTGSVILAGGGYTSAAETLSSGSATIDVPANSLAIGTDTLTATYTPDSSSSSTYDSSTGTSSVTVTTPTVTAPTVTLSPASLTFASETDGTTSAAQTVTLTNSGTAALTITSIAASGDFSQTNTCGASVAAGANCTISVTFTPTAAGARTGTVTITDNAGNSPQTVSLSGGGEAISISTASTGITISSVGGSGTATIQLSSVNGFTGTVNLTCAVTYLGQGTPTSPPTCSLSPAQAQVTGSSPVSSTLTIATTSASASVMRERELNGTKLALAAMFFFGLLPRRRYRKKLLSALCLVALFSVVGGGAIGCSGSSGGSNAGTPPTGQATTTGNYQVVVTATSGAVIASTTIPISVQ
jgi:hypothetical protein